jgi:hypothetical protein
MKRLLGLYREKEFSPGRHLSNDAQLLEQIAQQLRGRDFKVDLTTIETANDNLDGVDVIFSMCQGRAALEKLAQWQDEGANIINSPRAALNTHRDRLPKVMTTAAIPFPRTDLIATSALPDLNSFHLNGGLWLKRGDVHAAVAADVQRLDSPEKLRAGLKEFATRGIEFAALQENRAGDEIKFYGIGDDSLFHWFYSREPNEYSFNLGDLKKLTGRAAAAAGLDIFGGDVIVSPTGELTLIDLNDWPSFAPCRERASEAIADFIAARAYASES